MRALPITDGIAGLTNPVTSYEVEIDQLLSRFSRGERGATNEDDFGDLMSFLPVLGPATDRYDWKQTAVAFCEYALEHVGTDDRHENALASELTFLVDDLGIESPRARGAWERLLGGWQGRGPAALPAPTRAARSPTR
jgi:hypothetical protein